MRSVRSCCGAAPTSTSSPDDVWRDAVWPWAVWPWAGFALWHLAPQLVLPSPGGRMQFLPRRLTDGCGVRVALFRLGQGADEGPIDALTSNGLEARYSR